MSTRKRRYFAEEIFVIDKTNGKKSMLNLASNLQRQVRTTVRYFFTSINLKKKIKKSDGTVRENVC